tara:strand:- start:427 stop:864 length:438 start_codon:yes stop_codon:yes gene_type:complete
MGKVIEIGICKKRGQDLHKMTKVEAVKSKGLINDRHFKEGNDKKNQITLIEVENIDYFNSLSNTSIPYINFRRNIITKGIELNNLVGKEFYIGNVKLKAHDLCRPCKFLQDNLKQKNIIRELLLKGGLRCEVLSNGNISIGDSIR